MHPTLLVGFALLAWLVVRRRSSTSRVLLAAAGFVMGVDPAAGGNRLGQIVVAVAAGSAASIVWDGIPSTAYTVWSLARRCGPRRWRRQRRRRSAGREQECECTSDLLDECLADLRQAEEVGDQRAQEAIAHELVELADGMLASLATPSRNEPAA